MKKIFNNIKNYKDIILSFVIFVAVGAMMLGIYDCFLLAPDEYNYSHIAWTDITIDSFEKIITSQKSMYENWTGRIPVHTIIQLILWKGIIIYKILNPIVFATLVIFINKFTNKKIKLKNIVITIFCLVCTILSFGEKFLWLSGSLNYLWPTCLMIVVLKYYHDIYIEKKNPSGIKNLLMLVVSFFVGWSQENVAFLVGSFIIILTLYKIKDFIKFSIPKKIAIALNVLMFGLGALLLIFAPGNFSRLNGGTGIALFSNIKHIIVNFLDIKKLIAIYFISLVLSIGNEDNLEKRKELIKNEIFTIILPLGMALSPMLIIGEFPIRSMLPYEVLLIISIIKNLNYFNVKFSSKKLSLVVIGVGCLFIFGTFAQNLYIGNKYFKPYKNEVLSCIEIAKLKDEKDLELTSFYNEYTNLQMLLDYSPSTSRNGVINQYMAIYYGFDSIIAIGENEYLVRLELKDKTENAHKFEVYNKESNELIAMCDEEGSFDYLEFIVYKDFIDNCKIIVDKNVKNNIKNTEKICRVKESGISKSNKTFLDTYLVECKN